MTGATFQPIMISKRHFLTLLGFVSLSALTCAQAGVTWEPWLETGQDVYPSLLIATATVDWTAEEEAEEEEDADADTKDDADADADADTEEEDKDESNTFGEFNSWFGVSLNGTSEGDKVTVEISGDGWVKPSKVKVTIDRELEDVFVQPKMIYDYEALHKFRDQKPVNLTFKVSVNGKSLGEKTETLVMHQLNDCPYLVDNGEDTEPTDLTWMFAAYVNENHPAIDGILKEALETGMVDSFTGYQSGDKEVVMAQIFALWHVLQRRGIKYSDITATPGAKAVYSQTVRFMDDTVNATQANCVDGSVLMASVLRKIGLTTYLVMVPGHCYLAFDTDKESTEIMGLETTMLGNDKLKPLKDFASLPDKAKEKEYKASYKTFESALTTGTEDLAKNAEKIDAGDELNYQMVNIQEARDFGIMPLASAVR